MMPTSGETTIAVAVNTNERGDNLEGITEGETLEGYLMNIKELRKKN